jgi:hypothetical protein
MWMCWNEVKKLKDAEKMLIIFLKLDQEDFWMQCFKNINFCAFLNLF